MGGGGGSVRLPCPCCACRTLVSRGSYETCPVCLWVDDDVRVTKELVEAQQWYSSLGASHPRCVGKGRRPTERERAVCPNGRWPATDEDVEQVLSYGFDHAVLMGHTLTAVCTRCNMAIEASPPVPPLPPFRNHSVWCHPTMPAAPCHAEACECHAFVYPEHTDSHGIMTECTACSHPLALHHPPKTVRPSTTDPDVLPILPDTPPLSPLNPYLRPVTPRRPHHSAPTMTNPIETTFPVPRRLSGAAVLRPTTGLGEGGREEVTTGDLRHQVDLAKPVVVDEETSVPDALPHGTPHDVKLAVWIDTSEGEALSTPDPSSVVREVVGKFVKNLTQHGAPASDNEVEQVLVTVTVFSHEAVVYTTPRLRQIPMATFPVPSGLQSLASSQAFCGAVAVWIVCYFAWLRAAVPNSAFAHLAVSVVGVVGVLLPGLCNPLLLVALLHAFVFWLLLAALVIRQVIFVGVEVHKEDWAQGNLQLAAADGAGTFLFLGLSLLVDALDMPLLLKAVLLISCTVYHLVMLAVEPSAPHTMTLYQWTVNRAEFGAMSGVLLLIYTAKFAAVLTYHGVTRFGTSACTPMVVLESRPVLLGARTSVLAGRQPGGVTIPTGEGMVVAFAVPLSSWDKYSHVRLTEELRECLSGDTRIAVAEDRVLNILAEEKEGRRVTLYPMRYMPHPSFVILKGSYRYSGTLMIVIATVTCLLYWGISHAGQDVSDTLMALAGVIPLYILVHLYFFRHTKGLLVRLWRTFNHLVATGSAVVYVVCHTRAMAMDETQRFLMVVNALLRIAYFTCCLSSDLFVMNRTLRLVVLTVACGTGMAEMLLGLTPWPSESERVNLLLIQVSVSTLGRCTQLTAYLYLAIILWRVAVQGDRLNVISFSQFLISPHYLSLPLTG